MVEIDIILEVGLAIAKKYPKQSRLIIWKYLVYSGGAVSWYLLYVKQTNPKKFINIRNKFYRIYGRTINRI